MVRVLLPSGSTVSFPCNANSSNFSLLNTRFQGLSEQDLEQLKLETKKQTALIEKKRKLEESWGPPIP